MAKTTCSVEDCDRPVRIKSSGFCSKHYTRWLRHGDPLTLLQREPGPCTIEDCGRSPAVGRGLCRMHYQRWHATGTTGLKTTFERFCEKIIFTSCGCCWLWDAYVDPDGYGYAKIEGINTGAHVYAYEQAHGPLPDGLVVDHLCFNPSCVNPSHLRAVPPLVSNQRRRSSGYSIFEV